MFLRSLPVRASVLLFVAITGAMFEFTWLRRAAHRALGGTAADAPMVLESPYRLDVGSVRSGEVRMHLFA